MVPMTRKSKRYDTQVIIGTRPNLQIRIRGGWNLNQGAIVAVIGKYALQGCAAHRAKILTRPIGFWVQGPNPQPAGFR
jgi:hypothetical protein